MAPHITADQLKSPASRWGTETWPDLRLKWPQVAFGRLEHIRPDLTWQGKVDLSRLQTTWDVQKLWQTVGLLAWTLYVYCRLIIKCFITHESSYCFQRVLAIRPSVCLSVCHTNGSVKKRCKIDHQIFTIGCMEDSSFRNRKAFS